MKCPMCNHEWNDPITIDLIQRNQQLANLCNHIVELNRKSMDGLAALRGLVGSIIAEYENPAREVVSVQMEELLKEFVQKGNHFLNTPDQQEAP